MVYAQEQRGVMREGVGVSRPAHPPTHTPDEGRGVRGEDTKERGRRRKRREEEGEEEEEEEEEEGG